MDPRKFWSMCKYHDWYYFMSDDPGVFREGRDAEDELLRLTHEDPALMDIYNQWREHHFNAGARPVEPKLEE